MTFDGACLLLEEILKGDTRRQILDDLFKSKTLLDALKRLRDGMRSNVFKTGPARVDLEQFVKTFDARTRQDGFHVLHDWDGKADKLNKETIAVDVLNYAIANCARAPHHEKILAILTDYYFAYLAALLAMRAWDEGDPNANLDRVTGLIQHLQGSQGSRQQLVDNAETLIFVATSHFEPDGAAYERLLAKIRTLDEPHQLKIALIHSAILGCHLRYGFEFFYGRDIGNMRNDNGPDYPWLCFSLVTLMKAYAQLHDAENQGFDREIMVEGLLNGISPDARAFVNKAPASLAAYEADIAGFSELFQKYRADLMKEFESLRPNETSYSPMSFGFNFPHNLLKAMVVNALLWGELSTLTLNDLLTGLPQDERLDASRRHLAQTLAGYARNSPDTIRGRPTPAIVYDPYLGRRDFVKAMQILSN